jgi:hypothetical protein
MPVFPQLPIPGLFSIEGFRRMAPFLPRIDYPSQLWVNQVFFSPSFEGNRMLADVQFLPRKVSAKTKSTSIPAATAPLGWMRRKTPHNQAFSILMAPGTGHTW